VTVRATGHRREEPRVGCGASAVVILGKHQGTRPHNLELRGRVALGAAVWHGLSDPTAPVYFLAADTHGPTGVRDGTLVRSLLTERYQVPGDVVHVRRWSLCTLAEVRGIRALSRRRGFERVVAVTHGYHARRVAKYLGEVALRGEVLSVDPETLARLPVPAAGAELWQMIAEAVTAARIGFGHHVRERATEAGLTVLHRLDRRGRIERWLAKRARS